jgi:hypothetical protein
LKSQIISVFSTGKQAFPEAGARGVSLDGRQTKFCKQSAAGGNAKGDIGGKAEAEP